jgi:isochorismate pyruvate lyase
LQNKVRKLPSNCCDLVEVRSAIDEIDREIVCLIAERSQYVLRAAAFKSSLSAVEAKDRVAQVINARRSWAQELDVSSDLIEGIFEYMIKHFITKESEEWKRSVEKCKE